MKGEIEVALKTGAGAEEARQVLASNLEEVERLIRLIEKMLTLARLDRGGAPLETSEIDLAALAGQAAEEFRTLAEDKGVRLRLEAPSGAFVRGDETRLRGLLYILLDNAVKFTPADGTIGGRGRRGRRRRPSLRFRHGPGHRRGRSAPDLRPLQPARASRRGRGFGLD